MFSLMIHLKAMFIHIINIALKAVFIPIKRNM